MKNPAYHYHPETHEFIGITDRQASPREPGVYLIPTGATVIEPPKIGAREVAVFSRGAWIIEADWRGYKYFLSGGNENIINEIGIVPPKNTLTEIG